VRSPAPTLVFAAGALLAAAPCARAQDGDPPPPEGWVVRPDHGSADGIHFMEMPPGFHITSGQAAIFYDPRRTAAGTFRVESEIFLFDPGARNESFGVFIGGRDLAGGGQTYLYFLIRGDGATLVKRREGTETTILRVWRRYDAVESWPEREEGAATARNVLAVEAGAGELVFFVNGTEVARIPRAGEPVDGVVGIRVNDGLDLHVTSLDVTALDGPGD